MMQRNIRTPPKALRPVSLASFASLALLGGGCGTGGGRGQCNVGADCASGACSVEGKCVSVPPVEAGSLDGTAPADGSSVTDAAGDSASLPSPTGPDGSPLCVPNGDGTITRSEVPMGAGLRATYVVASNATWDTTGTIGDAGARTWDLTGALAGDHSVIFEAQAPGGAWWASSFAPATFAMQLAASQTLLGVFQVGDETLSLLGVVSPTNAAPSTEVTYATPVPTLKFPFTLGSTWTTTSNVTGTVSGVFSSYSEEYVTTVDAAGEMRTPFGALPVLRLGTLLTQTVGLVATYTRSFVWVAECVGPVAAATSPSSQTKPSATELSTVAEVRRLSP